MRPLRLFVFALLSCSLVVGCPKKNDDTQKSSEKDEKAKKKGKNGDKSDDKAGDDDSDDDKKGASGSGCKPPADIDGDYTVTKGCVVKVKGSLTVKEQGSLTLEKGAKLAFGSGEQLVVDGKLVAQGTADDPIVFTSSDDSPNPGDWVGVVFTSNTKKGTSLDHVKIEYAGKSSGYGDGAAVHLYSEVGPDRISITNGQFVHNSKAGIVVDNAKSKMAKLEGNSFKDDDKTCIAAPADVWSTIGQNTCGDQLAHVNEGTLSKTGSWPKVDSAYVLDTNLTIGGSDALVLTLPDGAKIEAEKSVQIIVGDGDGGGLVAKNIDFTSSAATPDAGDWAGLVIEEKATKTVIDGCTIEYAGKGNGYGAGAIILYNVPAKKIAKRVTITNTTMKNNDKGGISAPDGDCGDYDDPSNGNKSEGDPLCQK